MKEISNFFDKFRNVAIKELGKREGIVNVVNKYTNAGIDIKDINIKNSVLTIKANSSLKNEIFLKKKMIIDKLHKDLGLVIVDIR
jgi:hypothetical protein